ARTTQTLHPPQITQTPTKPRSCRLNPNPHTQAKIPDSTKNPSPPLSIPRTPNKKQPLAQTQTLPKLGLAYPQIHTSNQTVPQSNLKVSPKPASHRLSTTSRKRRKSRPTS
ncbi:hypothetical protein KC19_VG171600, partial [Ceratodon purpureus]